MNWVKTSHGNAIDEGTILKINAKGASHISGAIYQKGFPVLAIFGMGENAKILLKRKGVKLRGVSTLVLRAYDGTGVKDEFVIT